jgi:rhodanese-related sulfurtransferase
MSQRVGWSRVLILILLAVACAGVSNLAASRERKMVWVGTYSGALDTAPAAGEVASPGPAPTPAPGVSETSSASSATVASGAPAFVPTGVPTSVPAAASAAKTFSPHPDRASVEIGTKEAEQLFREKRLFLDARRSSVYADGHIPGARSFPVWESDIADRVKTFYEEGGGDRDQNAPIVIYCSGGDCEDSHMLAEKLYMVGFNNLLVYKDGFPGWQKGGLPAVRGPKP